jgi:hypothetical protein
MDGIPHPQNLRALAVQPNGPGGRWRLGILRPLPVVKGGAFRQWWPKWSSDFASRNGTVYLRMKWMEWFHVKHSKGVIGPEWSHVVAGTTTEINEEYHQRKERYRRMNYLVITCYLNPVLLYLIHKGFAKRTS